MLVMMETARTYLLALPRGKIVSTKVLCGDLGWSYDDTKRSLYQWAKGPLNLYHRRTDPSQSKDGRTSYYQWGNPTTFGPTPIPTTREPDIREKLLQLEGYLARIEGQVFETNSRIENAIADFSNEVGLIEAKLDHIIQHLGLSVEKL